MIEPMTDAEIAEARARESAVPLSSQPSEIEERPKCGLCGEPMPAGEEMFNYHGYSGNCPKKETRPETYIEEQDMCKQTAFPVPCPDCGGSGQVSDDATCFECKGEGYIYLEPMAAKAYAALEESHTNVCRSLAELRADQAQLAHIRAYAKEAARTPIDRDTILGCWDVEQLRMYAVTLREESTGLIRWILQPETYRFSEVKETK
jgi:hypothetical protein